jgi:curved DNA-binding protein CbpA
MTAAPDLLPMEGTLAEQPMAGLLARLGRQGFSGTLELTSFHRRNLVVFAAGRVTKVQLAAPIEQLGRLLVEQGLVEAAQVESLAARQAAGGGRLGDLLVAAGAVDQPTVDRVLADQLRRRVLRLFLLPEASWRLTPGSDLLAERGAAPESLDVLGVLAEGVRSSHDLKTLETRLTEVLAGRAATVSPGADLERLAFTAPEQSACRYLARGTWDATVFRAVPADHRHTLLVAAYCLHVAGLLTLAPAAVRAPDSPPPAAERSSLQPPAAVRSSLQPPAAARSSLQPPAAARPASQAPIPEGGDADGEFEQEICRLHEQLGARTHYELLGVARDVTEAALKDAYLERVKRYHPDRAARHGLTGHQDKLEAILLQIREAYETLRVPETRTKYDAQLKGQGEATAQQVGELVDRALAAERAYQMAVLLERQHRLDEAQRQADEALKLQPEQGEFVCMSLWLQAGRRPVRAAVDDLVPPMLEAATRVPRHERAQLQTARLLQRAGRANEALEHFRRVLRINPQNVDAAREVRLTDLRQAKQDGPSAGLFGRLFGKKDK